MMANVSHDDLPSKPLAARAPEQDSSSDLSNGNLHKALSELKTEYDLSLWTQSIEDELLEANLDEYQ